MNKFKPYPKTVKTEKEKAPGQWVGARMVHQFKKKNKPTKQKENIATLCRDGSRVTQNQINTRLSKAYKESPFSHVCECCNERKAVHHDHTISQARCKQIHATDLIWYYDNWADSCEVCHKQWESFKSGKFQFHKNVLERMLFTKRHDLEKFNVRMGYITDSNLIKILENA